MPYTRFARKPSWLLSVVFALGILPLVSLPGAGASARSAVTASAPGGARDLAVADPTTVGFSTERLTRLTGGMRQMVTDGRLAGIVTLAARHGKVVSFEAYGKKDVRKADAMEKDSIFRIYSMTKPITGVALMMLYEEGKWRLDDPVSKFIPEFSGLKVHAGENADGTPKLDDARRSMTMRELMTHSAGLGYGLTAANPVVRMYRDARVLDSSVSLQQMIDGLAKLPLLAQPGTRWAYSIAVDVQGYLVEELSGQNRRVPEGAHLRSARDEGHRVLRAGREARCWVVAGCVDAASIRGACDFRGQRGMRKTKRSGAVDVITVLLPFSDRPNRMSLPILWLRCPGLRAAEVTILR